MSQKRTDHASCLGLPPANFKLIFMLRIDLAGSSFALLKDHFHYLSSYLLISRFSDPYSIFSQINIHELISELLIPLTVQIVPQFSKEFQV